MKGFVCATCGHVEFDGAPEKCPVCGSPGSVFGERDAIKTKESEGAGEKHVPVIDVEKKCRHVGEGCMDIYARIGEVLHPMEEEHHIMWVDFYVDKRWVSRTLLTAGCMPVAAAHLKAASGRLTAIEFCNLHGHWIAEQEL